MYDDITIDDAVNIANVLNGSLALHKDEDVRQLALAAKQLVSHVAEQSREIERERARRHSLVGEDARPAEGHRLEEGTDGGGRRDFLAGRDPALEAVLHYPLPQR